MWSKMKNSPELSNTINSKLDVECSSTNIKTNTILFSLCKPSPYPFGRLTKDLYPEKADLTLHRPAKFKWINSPSPKQLLENTNKKMLIYKTLSEIGYTT